LLDTLSTDDWIERRLTHAEVRDWLEQLGQREREILAMRFGADLAASDIADLTGLTASNVHQIVSRSLRRLREVAQRDLQSKR
jgi:RNA polymerase sigma-70 factor (ECF subfamily)